MRNQNTLIMIYAILLLLAALVSAVFVFRTDNSDPLEGNTDEENKRVTDALWNEFFGDEDKSITRENLKKWDSEDDSK